MNGELLAVIRAAVLNRPERFDMSLYRGADKDEKRKPGVVGVSYCICSTAVMLADGCAPEPVSRRRWKSRADAVLGLDDIRGEYLCNVDYWPYDLRRRYGAAADAVAAAAVIAERIDRFVATGGSE